MSTEPIETPKPEPSQETPLVITNGEKQVEIKIGQVNELFRDIDKYNAQFSLGAMMAKLLTSRFEGHAAESIASAEEHQQMSASAISVIHERTIDNLGLSLEPVSGKKAAIFHAGEKAGEGEMRINVKDRAQFVSFLHALNPNLVQGSELKTHLGDLANVLAQQVLDHYNLNEPEDEALQLLGALDNIVGEYKRLGIDDWGTNRLATYLMHSRQGDLREYVLVEGIHLFQEPGKGFGPADWQKDASEEFLANKWEGALIVLRSTQANPKAHELYQQLLAHLKSCAEIAEANIDSLEYVDEAKKASFRRILQRTRSELEQFRP